MLRRRTLLLLSIAVSVLLHAALIGLAPRVPMLRVAAPAPGIAERFRVRVTEDLPPVTVEPEPDPTRDLTTRSGSVEELLKREREELRPAESLIEQDVSVPNLVQRVSTEPLTRTHDLQFDEAALKKVDARIIEIARETARQDIQIARRLVRPSPMRILGEDEFPVMRTEGADLPEELLTLDPLNPGGGLGGTGDEPPGLAGELPEREQIPAPAQALDTPEKILASLPDERLTGPQTEVTRATEEARKKYEFLDDLVDIEIATYRREGDPQGYFRLNIVPKAGESIEVLPKDVTFVIDASGSIAQLALDNTVKGLRQALSRLRPEDRFNLIVFRDTASGLERGFVEATPEEKEAALSFVRDLRSFGKTDVYSAIGPVVERAPRDGVPGVVFLVSDGRPSSGLLDSQAIINAVTDKNAPRNTVLAFGGGSTVNQYLLDLLAFRNKGFSYVSPSWNAIASDLPRFFGVVSDPILVDCHADYGRISE
ncbi:MAG TPA: VWA domain-containing protein, partial [Candidatus Hydrogenedentes bacterium]|nr:VWA domain-containing protein [Candidatus Hydrogenedentota bacterium]